MNRSTNKALNKGRSSSMGGCGQGTTTTTTNYGQPGPSNAIEQFQTQLEWVVTDGRDGTHQPVEDTSMVLLGESEDMDEETANRKEDEARARRGERSDNYSFRWADAKPEDIVGTLPYFQGNIYEDDVVRFCPNKACNTQMSWYCLMGYGQGENVEAFLCGNLKCLFLDSAEDQLIRPVKVPPKEIMEGASALVPEEVSPDPNEMAVVRSNLLSSDNESGFEPDMELVDKILEEWIRNGRKKEQPILLESDQFEQYAVKMYDPNSVVEDAKLKQEFAKFRF